MKSIWIALPALLFAWGINISTADAQQPDFSTLQSRREAVIESFKGLEIKERGKHGLPKAIAQLQLDPQNAQALDYITHILDPKKNRQSMFDFPGVALALCRYWDSFSPEQRRTLQTALERLAKSDKKDGEGFMGHGTENHALMMWAPAYLFAERFPDAKWGNGMSGEELRLHMKERMRVVFKSHYDRAYAEYLSTTYEAVALVPIVILYEYAEDPEVKALAEAELLFKWSLLALNTFDGEVIAPYARMNVQADRQPTGEKGTNIQALMYYNWMLWGWGDATDNVKLEDFTRFTEASYAVYAALAQADPFDVFFRLEKNRRPMTVRTSVSTFGSNGTGAPKMMLRKIFRNESYAIGTGNFRWVPGGDYADHDNCGFNILWSSPDRFNFIECYAPYWYSDEEHPKRTSNTWRHGSISPFQQTAQHENTAVTIVDIPDKDPWAGASALNRWEWRVKRADDLLKRLMLRFPKSIDEFVEENGWIFLREGKTYIGIKPLKDYYIQSDLDAVNELQEFHVVKSDHAKTGFIFELGTEGEFQSFQAFRERLPKNKIETDWNTTTVSYTNTRGDVIRIRYTPGLPIAPIDPPPTHWKGRNITGLAESIPEITINGKPEISVADWPMIDGPVVTLNDSVLRIDDGTTKISVDWQGEMPVIQK